MGTGQARKRPAQGGAADKAPKKQKQKKSSKASENVGPQGAGRSGGRLSLTCGRFARRRAGQAGHGRRVIKPYPPSRSVRLLPVYACV